MLIQKLYFKIGNKKSSIMNNCNKLRMGVHSRHLDPLQQVLREIRNSDIAIQSDNCSLFRRVSKSKELSDTELALLIAVYICSELIEI